MEPASRMDDPLEEAAPPGTERVLFQRFFPQAKQVSVAGSFNNWQPSAAPLTKCGGGRWRLDLPLKPGRYEYRFVVDGNWTDDPLGRTFVANPFGTRNCTLMVGASGDRASELEAGRVS